MSQPSHKTSFSSHKHLFLLRVFEIEIFQLRFLFCFVFFAFAHAFRMIFSHDYSNLQWSHWNAKGHERKQLGTGVALRVNYQQFFHRNYVSVDRINFNVCLNILNEKNLEKKTKNHIKLCFCYDY